MSFSHFRFVAAVLMGVATLSPAVFGQVDPTAPATPNVSFGEADGTLLRGYLSLPAGSGKSPAVLMVHEWWGLNNDVARLADALAEQGYVVLAADAFRGSVAQNPAEASRQVSSTPASQISGDLDAALSYLKGHPRVDSARVAVLGFCFGGTQAMRMGTRRADLAAVVIFYGSGPITDPEQLGAMREAGPVLGIYGAEDRNIPVSQVEGFRSALSSRGVRNQIEIYPGVGHAFVKSTTFRDGGAAQGAWERMLAFLKENI